MTTQETQLENTENKTFDMGEFLSALPLAQVRKSQTDGVTLYDGEKNMSSQGEHPLNLKKLITFLQRPLVQYDFYIQDNGEAVPKDLEEQKKQGLENQTFPYATLYSSDYIKPAELSLTDKRVTLVEFEGVDVDVLSKHIGNSKANVRVSITYPGMIMLDGALYLGLIQQGKYALWSFAELAPSQAFKRLGELTKALSPQSTAKFNMETGKPEVVSAKACTAVMWDEPVQLTDPKAPGNISNRGIHLIPAKSDSHGIPFIDLSETFKTPEAFTNALSSVEPLMEHPEFKNVILRVFESSLKSLLRMRHVKEADNETVVEVEITPSKKPATATLTKEEQELFSDDGI
jgi:hypothetical protein